MSSPKKQLKITFDNNCNAKFNEVDLRRAIRWYSNKPVFKFKKVFISGKYPAVSIYDRKIHIHRLLMMYWLKRDLASWEYVHHKDEDRLNSFKENLEVIPASEHQSNHNKGVPKSESFKRQISKANENRKGMKYKKKIYENPELLEGGKKENDRKI